MLRRAPGPGSRPSESDSQASSQVKFSAGLSAHWHATDSKGTASVSGSLRVPSRASLTPSQLEHFPSEAAARGSIGPIVGRRVVERHHATWDLAGRTAILQGVGEMEAGSEQCKESEDEKLLRVVG